MDDDLALLEAWSRGDAAAGEALFERHFDAVVRFFRNKVDDSPDDLVQRTFLGCVEARDRFRGDASFRTFVFAVAHNVLKNHFRARRQAPVDFSIDSAYGLVPSPSAVVARHRTQQRLLDALRRIPLDHQIAMELHYWEGLTAAELAATVDIPIGTAKTRLRRGKELLHDSLAALAVDKGELLDAVALDAEMKALRRIIVG
jgi:RNA polymerase sigma factor (sigma-70 family)